MVDNPFGRNAIGLSTTIEANSLTAQLGNRANDWKLAGRNACLDSATHADVKLSDSFCSPRESKLLFPPSQGRIALGLVLFTLVIDLFIGIVRHCARLDTGPFRFSFYWLGSLFCNGLPDHTGSKSLVL